MTAPGPANSTRSDRLLILLTYLDRTPAQDEWIRANVGLVADWDAFLGTCSDNRVVPMVRWQLDRLGLLGRVPAQVREALVRGAAEIAAANGARIEAGKEVLCALRQRGVEVVLLKGAMLAETLYANRGYKRMNDLDIFIHRADLATVYAVYRELGLFHIGERVGGDVDKQPEVAHYAPPFVNRSLTCMMGTQWAFRSPLLKLRFDYDAVWARTVPFELEGVELRRLGWEDQLHHLCVHLHRFQSGARDLMDLFNLVHAFEAQLDWELLRREIEAAGTEDYVYYALGLCQVFRPSLPVQDLLQQIAARVTPRIRALTAWRGRSPRVALRNCSRQFGEIEKAAAELNATQRFDEKLPRFVRSWQSVLQPPLDEALRICALPEPTLANRVRARARAPVELIRAISDEVGGLLLLGLAVKSGVDVVRAALSGRRTDGLQAYADRIGIPLDELRAIQKGVE